MYSVLENILRFLRSNGPSSRATVWAEFGIGRYKETDACIKDLLAKNLLSCKKTWTPETSTWMSSRSLPTVPAF